MWCLCSINNIKSTASTVWKKSTSFQKPEFKTTSDHQRQRCDFGTDAPFQVVDSFLQDCDAWSTWKFQFRIADWYNIRQLALESSSLRKLGNDNHKANASQSSWESNVKPNIRADEAGASKWYAGPSRQLSWQFWANAKCIYEKSHSKCHVLE